MKTLYLLRHAKSSWDAPGIADLDRPLNETGQTAAAFMGDLIASIGYDPAIILSSPAERARATALIVTESAGWQAPVIFDDRIYEASPQGLKQVISEIEDLLPSAAVIGHNP